MAKAPGSLELTHLLNAKVDLVSFLENHGVALKKRGNLYEACCPFHEEKTPSFKVYPQTQNYYCFGCGAHGHASHFLKKRLNMSGVETVRYLAELTHTTLDDAAIERWQIVAAQATKTREILSLAASFYAENLRDTARCSQANERAMDYLIETRQFAWDTCKVQRIGVSASNFSLVEFFRDKHTNYTPDDLIAAGVAREGKNGGAVDYFRGNRIIFPIFDTAKNVVMMSGRVINNSENPKYLHTPHQKSEMLYGIHALQKGFDKLIVVEGHLDALRGIEFNLPVVAMMGGRASEWQLQRLLELSCYGEKPIYLCGDTDKVGIKGMFDTIKLSFKHLNNTGGLIKVVQLPSDSGEKVDLDSFLLAHGIEEFNGVSDGALPASEFFKQAFLKKYTVENFDSQLPEVKATLAAKLSDELKDVPAGEFKLNLQNFCLDKPQNQDDVLSQVTEFLIPEIEEENPFPIDALGSLGKLATEILAKNIQCSPNMIAHAVLATMAISTCQFAKIQSYSPNSDDDTISLNGAFITVAESSEGKGRVESSLLNGLLELNDELKKTYHRDELEFKAKMKSYEIALSTQLKAEAKNGTTNSALNQLPPSRVRNQSFIFETPTIQAVQKAFEKGASLAVIATDEAMQFLAGWSNQDGRQSATLATYNKLIDKGSISRNTATDDFHYVKRSIILNLAIQPQLWDSWISQGNAKSLGFLARFLTIRPTSTQGYRDINPPLTENETWQLKILRQRTDELMKAGLQMAADKDQLTDSPKYFMGELVNRITLKCDSAALSLWHDFFREIEPEKARLHRRENRPGMFYEVREIMGKYDQFVGKIAGWLTIWECEDIAGLISQQNIPIITEDTMKRAIRITRFYLDETLRIAQQPKIDPLTEKANKLLQWMHNPVVKRGSKFVDFESNPIVTEDGYRVFTVTKLMQYSPIRESKSKIIELLNIIAGHDGQGRLETGVKKNTQTFHLAPKK